MTNPALPIIKAGISTGPVFVLLCILQVAWVAKAADPGGDLRDRDVAVVGSDAASDVLPSGVEGVAMPVHQLCLVAMGVWILDNCDLESLAEAARRRGRWEFLISVSPLVVPGGTGSPLNPVATF